VFLRQGYPMPMLERKGDSFSSVGYIKAILKLQSSHQPHS